MTSDSTIGTGCVPAAIPRRSVPARVGSERAAPGYHVETDDMPSAIERLCAIDENRQALDLFCAQWDSYRRKHGWEGVRALCDLFPLNDLLADLEACSVAWLVHSALSSASPGAPCATRVLGASESELAALSLRARITVRTASMSAWLGRDGLEQAEAVALEAHSELEQAPANSRILLGGVYREFILTAARTALHRGSLRKSAALYDEALAFSELAADDDAAYRALTGRSLVLTFNAEFGAAQQLIDRARHIEERLALASSRDAVELLWSQSVIWVYGERQEELAAAARMARALAHTSGSWNALAYYLEARSLVLAGFRIEAASALRTLLGSVLAQQCNPLFRQSAAAVLGLTLLMSRQAGAALEAVRSETSNEDHAPCFAFIRSFALIERGDPEAAIEATEPCLRRGHDHATLGLVYVYIARSLAFEVLALHQAAEESFLVAWGFATNAGIRLDLDGLVDPRFERLVDRARVKAPLLSDISAFDIGGVVGPRAGRAIARRLTKLTTKEREVLAHLVGQETLGTIARRLFISENTVKTHTRNLYRKLDVTSRSEAVDLAVGWGVKRPSLEPARTRRQADA